MKDGKGTTVMDRDESQGGEQSTQFAVRQGMCIYDAAVIWYLDMNDRQDTVIKTTFPCAVMRTVPQAFETTLCELR
jgi:hypothetical protein